MNFTSTIHAWFARHWGGSLLLPDGWHGRPYDNQHALTRAEEHDDTLTVILDGKLALHFDGLKSVKSEQQELVFGPFKRLRFSFESFDSNPKQATREYLTGEARIVARRI